MVLIIFYIFLEVILYTVHWGSEIASMGQKPFVSGYADADLKELIKIFGHVGFEAYVL